MKSQDTSINDKIMRESNGILGKDKDDKWTSLLELKFLLYYLKHKKLNVARLEMIDAEPELKTFLTNSCAKKQLQKVIRAGIKDIVNTADKFDGEQMPPFSPTDQKVNLIITSSDGLDARLHTIAFYL